MAKRIKSPADLAEAAGIVREIGSLKRRAAGIQNELNEKIGLMKKAADGEIWEIEEKVRHGLKRLYKYAADNKSELTKEGKIKTVRVLGGEFGWRTGQKSVVLEGDKDEIIALLERLGRSDFIRVEKKLNRKAMIENEKEAKDVPGIEIKRKNFFYVKPETVAEPIKLMLDNKED